MYKLSRTSNYLIVIQPTKSVVVYGRLSYFVGDRLKVKGIEVARPGSANIENYDLIIIYPGAYESMKNDDRRDELIVRIRDIRNALRKGSHVCILVSNIVDPLNAEIYSLFSYRYIQGVKEVQEISIKRSEFDTFIRGNGIAFALFPYHDSMSVICTVKTMNIEESEDPRIVSYHDEFVVGFSSRIGKGLLTILPFYISDSGSSKPIDQVILQLVKSLDTHKKNTIFDPPTWVSQVKTKKESDFDSELSEINKKVDEIASEIEHCVSLKSVLWLKHNELRNACVRLLGKIGIETFVKDIGEEDFWITKGDVKSVICECKGLDNNLERTDLSKFDEHREARGKDEKFPALLIVNSFNKAETLELKDVPIPSNVIQKAISSNFLIIRTLDLIYLLDLFERQLVTKEQILQIFQKERGWLRVKDNFEVIKR